MRVLNMVNAGVVQRINPLENAKWDEMLPTHPDCSFFHGAAWARVLQETYGYAPSYFFSSGGERVRALLPVVEVDSWLTGRRGVSLPFTDYCRPLVSDAMPFQELFQKTLDYGQIRGWKHLELRGGKGFLGSARASNMFYGHELSLVGDLEGLFASLKGPVRRAIRKAEKLGLAVEVLKDLEAVRAFYELQCKTRKKHGLPPQPFRFFRKIHEHILASEKGIVVLARQGRKAVAGAVFFHAGEQAVYKYGASDETFQESRGNNLVIWEAIKWYANRGFKVLHLGRTSLANEGLRSFKLAWGAREEMIEYVSYDLKLRAFVAGRDEAFGWYNRVFRVLPIGASRLAGALLYRHVG